MLQFSSRHTKTDINLYGKILYRPFVCSAPLSLRLRWNFAFLVLLSVQRFFLRHPYRTYYHFFSLPVFYPCLIFCHWFLSRLSIFEVVHVCFFFAAFLYSLRRFSIHVNVISKSFSPIHLHKMDKLDFFRLRCLWFVQNSSRQLSSIDNFWITEMNDHAPFSYLRLRFSPPPVCQSVVSMERREWAMAKNTIFPMPKIVRRCSRDKTFYAK